MKYILTFIFCYSFVAYAQEPVYTPMRNNYQFRGIKIDSLFLIPSFTDTTAANSSTMKNVAGAMIRTGNDFWMRNATTNGWLQNVNVGNGSSTQASFVVRVKRGNLDTILFVKNLSDSFAFKDKGFDTLKRRSDSVFRVKYGTETFQYKDSTGGGGGTDSPDRIDGTATGNVLADMDGNGITFQDVKPMRINGFDGSDLYVGNNGQSSLSSGEIKLFGSNITLTLDTNAYNIKDFNTTFVSGDTLGNITLGLSDDSSKIEISRADKTINFYTADPMIWKDKANGLKSQVKTGYGDNGIDLSAANYQIEVPGIYIIATSDVGGQISLPDAALWKGQSVQIVNTDGSTAAPLGIVGAGSIFDRGTLAAINSIDAQFMAIFYSDGTNWFGFKL